MTKSIVILVDGTGNGVNDPHPTNVRIIRDSIDRSKHMVFYHEGPGNSENIIEHFLGGVFGIDCRSIRDEALEQIDIHYDKGDTIIIIGFSRGAAIARMIAYELSKLGIRVKFLAVFDTVFAGLPFGTLQQKPLFSDLHVSPLVENVRHAVSLDENRKAFKPNLMCRRDGIKEVWFKGNHADIGGGYKDRGLADVALRWMAQEAAMHGGLFFTGLPKLSPPNKPHYEDGPYPRAPRRVGVKVDGGWSQLTAVRYQAYSG